MMGIPFNAIEIQILIDTWIICINNNIRRKNIIICHQLNKCGYRRHTSEISSKCRNLLHTTVQIIHGNHSNGPNWKHFGSMLKILEAKLHIDNVLLNKLMEYRSSFDNVNNSRLPLTATKINTNTIALPIKKRPRYFDRRETELLIYNWISQMRFRNHFKKNKWISKTLETFGYSRTITQVSSKCRNLMQKVNLIAAGNYKSKNKWQFIDSMIRLIEYRICLAADDLKSLTCYDKIIQQQQPQSSHNIKCNMKIKYEED